MFVWSRGSKILLKTIAPRGLRIAIVGPDGAGKSTLAHELSMSFMGKKISVRKYYMGSGDGYRSIFKKTISTRQISKNNSAVSRSIRDLFSVLFYTELSINYYVKSIKAQIHALTGKIVIFDRYPQCQYPGLYDGPKIDLRMKGCSFPANVICPIFARIETYFVSRAAGMLPEIVVRLNLPAEASVMRKPDHSIGDIKKKSEITRTLRFDGALILDVDALQSVPETVRQVEDCVQRVLQLRDSERVF